MSVGPVYGCSTRRIAVGWSDIRELLQDVFVDMHRAWVQDYLLQSDYQTQAELLTTRGRQGRSIAITQRIQSDARCVSPENAVDKFSVSLVVPHRIKDGLATALMIESNASASGFVRRTDRAVRSVVNTSSCSVLFVSVDNQHGLVEILYDNSQPGRERRNVLASFVEANFRAAVQPGVVDFSALQRSLRLMYAGVTDGARCGIPLLHAPNLQNVTMCGPAFPRRGELGAGDYYQHGVFSVHVEGVPVFSTNSPVYGSRNIGAHTGAVDALIDWGVRDALTHLSPVPQAPISQLDVDTGELLSISEQSMQQGVLCVDSYANSQTLLVPDNRPRQVDPLRLRASSLKPTTVQPRRPRVLLAPASVTQSSTNGEPTFAQKKDAEYRAKQELKKRRNRLAAARSNAKKSAERKKRTQRNSNNTKI